MSARDRDILANIRDADDRARMHLVFQAVEKMRPRRRGGKVFSAWSIDEIVLMSAAARIFLRNESIASVCEELSESALEAGAKKKPAMRSLERFFAAAGKVYDELLVQYVKDRSSKADAQALKGDMFDMASALNVELGAQLLVFMKSQKLSEMPASDVHPMLRAIEAYNASVYRIGQVGVQNEQRRLTALRANELERSIEEVLKNARKGTKGQPSDREMARRVVMTVRGAFGIVDAPATEEALDAAHDAAARDPRPRSRQRTRSRTRSRRAAA